MRTWVSSLANSEAKGTWGFVRRFPLAFVIRNIMGGMGLGPDSMGLGLVSRRRGWE